MKVIFSSTFDKKGKWRLAQPLTVQALEYPESSKGRLHVKTRVTFPRNSVIISVHRVRRALTITLSHDAGASLYGLCGLRLPGQRSLWFLKHAHAIRNLLPPVARLAFDRWYPP